MAMAFEAKTQKRHGFKTLADIPSRVTCMDDEEVRTLAQRFGCEESRTDLLQQITQRREGFSGSVLGGVNDEEEDEEEEEEEEEEKDE